MNEQRPNGQSQSLFSSSRDESHSLSRANDLQLAEKRARMKRFLVWGLPLCVLVLIGAVAFLWEPVKAIVDSFKPHEEPPPPSHFHEMEKQRNETQEERDERLGKFTVKGNPNAKFVIVVEGEDKSQLRQGHEEILNDAVNTKPSEIYLKMRFSAGGGSLKITFNGDDTFELVQEDGTKHEFYLSEANETQWSQALTEEFEKIYGAQLHPLEPKITETLRDYRSQPRPEPLPDVIPKALEEKADGKPGPKPIVLPKFEAEI